MSVLVKERLLERFEALPYEMQTHILNFAEALLAIRPQGVPGAKLLKFAGAIPAQDLSIMRKAIKDGCEQTDNE